jgi:hypothetical protein
MRSRLPQGDSGPRAGPQGGASAGGESVRAIWVPAAGFAYLLRRMAASAISNTCRAPPQRSSRSPNSPCMTLRNSGPTWCWSSTARTVSVNSFGSTSEMSGSGLIRGMDVQTKVRCRSVSRRWESPWLGASFHSRFSCAWVPRFCSIHCPLVPC